MNRLLPHLPLLPVVLFAMASTSCTTVENYRDLYFSRKILGPYTHIQHYGIPKNGDSAPIAPVSPAPVSPTSSSDGKNVIKPQS